MGPKLEQTKTSCGLMLFDALGDLGQRKLFPALYQLERANLLARGSRILAIARNKAGTDEVRNKLLEKLRQHVKPAEFDENIANDFLQLVDYLCLDFAAQEGYQALNEWRDADNNELIVYMATPPSMYGVIARNMKSSQCCNEHTRVVVEKPIGHDLESSKVINDELGEVYNENQLFRIDHYLGKETVQNLIALRFANNLFAS